MSDAELDYSASWLLGGLLACGHKCCRHWGGENCEEEGCACEEFRDRPQT